MKRRNIIVGIIMAAALGVGCGSKSTTDDIKSIEVIEEASGEEVIETGEPVEEPAQNEEIKLSDLIPNPESTFLNTEFEYVTTDDSYIVYLDYVTDEEWDDYITNCEKQDFWVNESYRSEYSWYVSSEDYSYELLLDRYGDQNVYMTIIVSDKVLGHVMNNKLN